MKTQALREINSEFTELPTRSSGVVTLTSSTSRSHETGLPPNKKPKLSKLLNRCFGNTEVRLTPQQRVKQEIDQYLMHPQLNIEGDPLPWW